MSEIHKEGDESLEGKKFLLASDYFFITVLSLSLKSRQEQEGGGGWRVEQHGEDMRETERNRGLTWRQMMSNSSAQTTHLTMCVCVGERESVCISVHLSLSVSVL